MLRAIKRSNETPPGYALAGITESESFWLIASPPILRRTRTVASTKCYFYCIKIYM